MKAISLKKSFCLDDLSTFIFAFFLMFTIFFPTSKNIVKLTLFSILFVYSMYKQKGVYSIPIPVIIYVIYNLMSIFIGLLNGAPGALRTSTVTVIYPIAFSMIFISLCHEGNFKTFSKAIILIATIVSTYDILYCISQIGYIRLPGWFFIDSLNMSFTNHFGYTHFTTTHINVLFFLLPFSMSILMKYNNGDEGKIIKKNRLIFSIILQYVCVILATRIAMVTISILSIAIIFAINIFLESPKAKKTIKRVYAMYITIGFIIIVGLLIYFSNYLGMVLSAVYNKFIVEGQIGSTSPRAIQADALINGWIEKPLLGHGAGSYTPLCIRSEEMPWSYELTYHALLFQSGIVGFVITFGLYFFIIFQIIKAVIKDKSIRAEGVAYASGLICFLIANAVDPYLGKFGYMWVIYMPLAFGSVYTYKVKDNYE